MRNDGANIVQIYCGDGKGKTTAAVGQALRAAGNGYKVCFIQFLKDGKNSGEIEILSSFPGIDYRAFGTGEFIYGGKISDEIQILVKEGIEYAAGVSERKLADMLILDEIGSILENKIIAEQTVIDIIMRGKGWLDIVFTGRYFTKPFLNNADLITRMEMVKHHYNSNCSARRGIEF